MSLKKKHFHELLVFNSLYDFIFFSIPLVRQRHSSMVNNEKIGLQSVNRRIKIIYINNNFIELFFIA